MNELKKFQWKDETDISNDCVFAQDDVSVEFHDDEIFSSIIDEWEIVKDFLSFNNLSFGYRLYYFMNGRFIEEKEIGYSWKGLLLK